MYGNWRIFKNPDGILVPIEFDQLPFEPRRLFYVKDVPKGEERGMHAHYKTEQILTCIKGEILVKLFDGVKWDATVLTPDTYIYIGPMVWDSQVFLTGEDFLISICSTPYDKNDYIEDMNQFIKEVERRKNESSVNR